MSNGASVIPESAMSCRCPGRAGGVSPDAGVFVLVNSLRDPRDPRGRQYPLGAVLLIALCALACRFDSFRAMGQWAAAAPPSTLERLGLRRRGAFGLVVAPSQDTIRRVVNAVMPGGLEQLLRVFRDKAQLVAVDGKCLRGSRDAAGRAVMVLGAMLQDGTLAAQQKVADKGSEITGFAALLAALELQDAVVVADALHTQREHARVLVEEFGAHYAFPVKRNQPELWKACRKVPWQGVRAAFRSTVRAHGRIDTRVVEVVSFAGLDFPYARQVARITRYRTVRASGKRSRETVYVITDLSSAQAGPQRIGEVVQAVSIPVIGNGDLTSAADVKPRREQTGVAGVMIGRGAMQSPWIFSQVRACLETSELLSEPSLEEQWQFILRHCRLAVESRGVETPALHAMRARLMAYSRGMPLSKQLRMRFQRVSTLSELDEIAEWSIDESRKLPGQLAA